MKWIKGRLMLVRCFVLICVLFAAVAMPALAQHNHGSKYAGQERREIKSLSPDDLKELRRGGGWGLAKAAELNGMPGPAHLLEMKDKIALTPDQVAKIKALFQDMQGKAIITGKKLIALEKKLELAFQSGGMPEAELRAQLDAIAKVRAQLRFVHLATHLKTPGILSKTQITRYNTLRGYAKDPCASVPKGHDATMWRKHNGCK